ncbi:MAG: HDIG domain-containing protein [Bacillota bacterium]|nr:HDIG domain-containing protein [Bacillota bacterium]
MKKRIIPADLFSRSISFRENKRLQKLLLVVALFATIYGLLAIVSMPARFDINVGRPSPRTVYAPRDAVDEFATERLREQAATAVPEVYDYDPSVLENALARIGTFFDTVLEVNDNDELELDEKIELLKALIPDELPSTTVTALLTDSMTIRDLQGRLNNSVSEIFEQGIREEEEDLARRRLTQEIALYPFSADLKRVSESYVRTLVEQNMTHNIQATEDNRELARSQVEPVIILRNTLIVSEGEPVTEQQMAQLTELGLIRGQQADYAGYLGLFLLLMVVFIIVGIYMSVFVNHVYNNPNLMLLMGLIFIVTLILTIATTYFSGYLIPVATGVILITVIFGYKLALIINMALALMVGLITGGEFPYILIALLGGLVSIYAVTRLSQRSDLARAGFYVAATNSGVILAIYLFLGNVNLEYNSLVSLGYSLLAGIGNGIFSSVVAIGLLPFLESLFGVTTAITLLELSNPNHPLLKELLMKAPGTYYHSMMVSNLAESAAESVQADALLTRVGAYYHDIGKLKRPYFFSENQLSGENPHMKLSPNLSALIIGSHPKDGVELGQKHRLPEVILDIAIQHHGTSMISFFYQKAVENNSCREEVSADKFRYEGPKPQTKEAAIIMLADAVEAGVRSLSKPTSSRVEAMIKRMIKEKLDDGQLDQSDLTLKELDRIADSFVYIMSGIYHSRIEYPEKDLKAELERSPVIK